MKDKSAADERVAQATTMIEGILAAINGREAEVALSALTTVLGIVAVRRGIPAGVVQEQIAAVMQSVRGAPGPAQEVN